MKDVLNSTTSITNVINTSFPLDYDRTKEVDWVIPVSVNLALICFTLWILYSLVHHGRKTKKWKTIFQTNLEKLNSGLVYTSIIACAALCVVRLVTNQAAMHVGFGADKDKQCDITADALVVTYTVLVFSTYVFLWIRQRAFYVNQMLSFSFSKVLRGFSAISIAVILLSGTVTSLINTLPNDYSSTSYGCVYKPNESLRAPYIISGVVSVFLGQVILFGLFIYPLQKGVSFKNLTLRFRFNSRSGEKEPSDKGIKSTTSDRVGSVEPGTGTTTTTEKKLTALKDRRNVIMTSRPPTSHAVKRIMKRTLGFAVALLSTDVFLLIISNYVIPVRSHRRLSNMAYDINSLLNLLFVIFSFVNYKKMLFSPFFTYESEESS